MELDSTIARAKELIAKREEIDAELAHLFTGATPTTKRVNKCSVCQKEGHSSRTCPDKAQE